MAGCASNNQLKEAQNYIQEEKFVPAILLYDKFMGRNEHSAEATIAELRRSECYYQLGLQAYSKENWILADRLFYLSNTDRADELADNVHWELSQKSELEGDVENQLHHYRMVVDYIRDSEFVPDMLLKRIDIYIERNLYLSAYNDYKKLWDKYGDTDQSQGATQKINPIIPWFLKAPQQMRKAGNYSTAIAEFELYASYPSQYQQMIYDEIGGCYFDWAKEDRQAKNYQLMKEHLELAEKNSPALGSSIDRIIDEICEEFVAAGSRQLNSGEIDSAIKEFSKCFVLKPGHSEVLELIENAKEQKIRFARADSLYQEAETAFEAGEYQTARELFQKSHKLSQKGEVKAKSEEMSNYIRAEKSPKEFALTIVNEYRQGLIRQNVDKRLNALVKEFGDQVSSSDWKIVYSYGKFNYEVRIDIFSPRKSYYFAWRVNLIERSISPLNKDSEIMMQYEK